MQLSKRNRRAIVILLLLTLVIIYTPRMLSAINTDHVNISVNEIETIEEELIRGVEPQKPKESKRYTYRRPDKRFNPNDYKQEDWMKLGLSKKQANVILKFTKYGISSDEELKKVFVIPDELFELMIDSTYYPAKPEHTTSYSAQKKEEVRVISVELNSATMEEFQELPGIGPYYSKKIVEYREKLGGYVSKQQLLEIWKFDALMLDKIKDAITLDVKQLDRINLNEATFEEISSHPYISYKVANSIVKMREQHGAYKSIEDILQSRLIDHELFVKLKPYLSV